VVARHGVTTNVFQAAKLREQFIAQGVTKNASTSNGSTPTTETDEMIDANDGDSMVLPLQLKPCGEGSGIYDIIDANRSVIAGMVCDPDAARIVACVNACAGIPTDQLSQPSPPDDLAAAEIESAWRLIESEFDIEPRAQIEAEAKTNGFKYGLAQAIHTIWKRDPKVAGLARELDAARAECERLNRFFGGYKAENVNLSEAIKTLWQQVAALEQRGR